MPYLLNVTITHTILHHHFLEPLHAEEDALLQRLAERVSVHEGDDHAHKLHEENTADADSVLQEGDSECGVLCSASKSFIQKVRNHGEGTY